MRVDGTDVSISLLSSPSCFSLFPSSLSSFSFSSLSVLRAFLLTSESERREAKGIARARYDKEICTSPTLSRCRARIIMCLLRSSFQRYGVYRYEAAVLSHLELVEQLFVSTLVIRCIFPSFERASSRSHRTESSRYGWTGNCRCSSKTNGNRQIKASLNSDWSDDECRLPDCFRDYWLTNLFLRGVTA